MTANDSTKESDLTMLPNEEKNDEVEENADFEGENFYPVEYAITSYGADYPVDGLVKRINNDSIFVPKFQREYVWNIYKASRFIESLLFGLPVPSIFLSKELDSNKLLVIDGQQRLRSLQYFYNGIFEPSGREFKLKGVHPRYADVTYKKLRQDDRLRLDDSIVHAIVVKQDAPKTEDELEPYPTSVYHIFERLNTGGMTLLPQEIRSCMYHGPFIELLESLNADDSWRSLFGKVSARMRDRELIIRFFALFYCFENYTKPMKEFLTRFVSQYRKVEKHDAEELTEVFVNTCSVILEALGDRAFKPKTAVNAAFCDAIMVAVANRLKTGPIQDYPELKRRHVSLLENEEFQEAITSGTTDESNLRKRIEIATQHFGDTP